MIRNCLRGVILALVVSAPSLSRAAEATPEQQSAAMEMLRAMHMDTMLSDAIDQMLDIQIKQNPSIEKFRPTMVAFLTKYMSFDAMKDDLAKIYGEEFTVQELTEMTAFYQTPTGRKMASKMTVLMTKGAALGQRKVQEHMAELQDAIKEAAK